MSNIIELKAPWFSRRVDVLLRQMEAGGLYWNILVPDEEHRKRQIPPDLSFWIIPPDVPTQAALDAAVEFRQVWCTDGALRKKMVEWHAERGLIYEKWPMTDPSTWKEGGAA